MEGIVLVVALAIITEALIEYVKNIAKAFGSQEWKTAVTQLVAIGISITLCFATAADLFAAVGLTFIWPWLGKTLTGVLISRGANFVSDFIARLQGAKKE